MPDWIPPAAFTAFILAFLTALYKFSYWRGEVDTDRKNFSKFMNETRQDIKGIFRRLPDPLVESASHVPLTKRGKRAAEQLDAYSWASRVAAEQADQVAGKKEFEVYSFCQEYVETAYRKDRHSETLAKVKEIAYEHGAQVSQVKNLLAVVLRDELFEVVLLAWATDRQS